MQVSSANSSTRHGAASRIFPLEQEAVTDEEQYTDDDGIVSGSDEENGKPTRVVSLSLSSSSSSSSWAATESDDHKPSNEHLLGTAFLSFMSFALLEIVFASIAGSNAMMGDGAAMMVDAMTYLLNWYAERQKRQLNIAEQDDKFVVSIQSERAKRKRVLQLEIISPLLSVSTLLVITTIVLHQAIHTLILDLHRSRSEQLMPNIDLMFMFSFLNLLLDCLNVYCFARAKHLLGFATAERVEWNRDDKSARKAVSTARRKRSYFLVHGHDEDYDDDDEEEDESEHTDEADHAVATADQVLDTHALHHHSNHQHANLNMCSAYTHVFADTLRSIAVLIAAALAKLVPGVSSEEADATAAIFVSILIVLSLFPLIQGLWKSFSELRSIISLE